MFQVQGDITMFAYMTHTHALGTDITGYIRHKGDEKEFAKGDPQEPQTFHQMEHYQVVVVYHPLLGPCKKYLPITD